MEKITIDECRDLSELVDFLNRLELETRKVNEDNHHVGILQGRSYDEIRVSEIVDLTSLPTYGGEAPQDTYGIYSWDADSLLYYDGVEHDRPWVISPRDESKS